ncbi:RNA polymerase sigma factor [Antrihabitans sp. YC2-6]|uniref:RNA polymerase sigma factor n=1 Tax=Antrihabitans sp. YC2-6 TaxID=2799498 RepID=UPI0018F5515B|nr:sigma-70 family RNA polymerase sigma factor [Antrihabitans sp. YC2-6]MBJ8347983.1 sigma-70 family RNA polymerase sigma factor [Antrihabitans sp. YC2-6]
MRTTDRIEYLLRDLAPQVLGAVYRRYGHFDVAEDAVQEALLVAAQQWPADGVPEDPRPWLIRIASRKMIDQLRSDRSRREREDADALQVPVGRTFARAPDDEAPVDDSLLLLILCCHPALTRASQVALTLRAVGGLTTAEIAHALLVPESTMGQRISRAKQTIKKAGATFAMPPVADRGERLDAVMQVLYLIFNEGYTSTSGADLHRVELSAEAIRLTRILFHAVPGDGEVAGLLSLMLSTDARRAARTTAGGALVPMAEQDRTLWDSAAIAEGAELVTAAMKRKPLGPYQLQAAIAAVHNEAEVSDDTDWVQILGLYGLLEQLAPNPIVTLNRAVALAMVRGPNEALDLVASLGSDERIADHHRFAAVRAHLHDMAGDRTAAAGLYREAARATTSIPEQRYLLGRAARLEAPQHD